MSARRSAAWLVALHALAGFLFLSPGWIRPDSVGVYAWLRSAVFDRDLLFFNEWHAFGMIGNGVTFFKEVTPYGTLADHWWIGTSLLSAPAYLIVRAASALAGWAGDGFGGAYSLLLAWSSVGFGWLTLVIAHRL